MVSALMVIPDTDHLSILEWTNSPSALALANRLEELPAQEIGTTIITFEEKTRGWLSVLAKARKIKEQVEVYRRLNRQIELFCSFLVLDFDEQAAINFQGLKKEKPRLGTADLKIAAIVLAQEATLLSRNLRDFQQIPALKVEDWTK
jgi:tRNA(fMet)-specific endonuclease VapC